MSKPRSKEKNPPLPKDASTLTDAELDAMESDPRFREMMRRGEEDQRQGRWITNEELRHVLP
jgi:hypothetical protein